MNQLFCNVGNQSGFKTKLPSIPPFLPGQIQTSTTFNFLKTYASIFKKLTSHCVCTLWLPNFTWRNSLLQVLGILTANSGAESSILQDFDCYSRVPIVAHFSPLHPALSRPHFSPSPKHKTTQNSPHLDHLQQFSIWVDFETFVLPGGHVPWKFSSSHLVSRKDAITWSVKGWFWSPSWRHLDLIVLVTIPIFCQSSNEQFFVWTLALDVGLEKFIVGMRRNMDIERISIIPHVVSWLLPKDIGRSMILSRGPECIKPPYGLNMALISRL